MAYDYEWPYYNVLKEGGFESLTKWTTTGSANTTYKNTGSQSLELALNEIAHQSINVAETPGTTFLGRWLSKTEDYLLTGFVLNPGSVAGVISFRLQLEDADGTAVYIYDWYDTKWVAVDTSATAGSEPENFYHLAVPDQQSWTEIQLPKIRPLVSATESVTDSYSIQLYIKNVAGVASAVYLDDFVLRRWSGDVQATRVGRFTVFTNGWNVPMKYDPSSNVTSELSLPMPYYTLPTGTDLPGMTSSAVSGGGLVADKYYAYAYCWYDDEVGEESAFPWGIYGASGIFYEQVSTGHNTLTINFTNTELPNSESAPSTDNGRIKGVRIWRSFGFESTSQIEALFEGEGVPFYYLTSLDKPSAGAWNYSDGIADNALPGISEAGYPIEPLRLAAPQGGLAVEFRNRLWMAGGKTVVEGAVDVTKDSHLVVGETPSGGIDHTDSTPPTLWNRAVEGMLFQVDNDPDSYLIEQYIYPGDDGTTTTNPKIYLSLPYRGTSATNQSYKIYPEPGKIWYSDENQPMTFSSSNWISLDGGEGGEVTLLQPAGQVLVACTKDYTYGVAWNSAAPDANFADVISRSYGCIAPGSGAEVRGIAFWLSGEGVVRYRPGSEPEVISDALGGMFGDPQDDDYIARDAGTQMAIDAQGIHYWPKNQYMLAVRTKNGREGCDMILVYNYFFGSWDIYRLKNELARWFWTADDAGNNILCFSDTNGHVWKWDYGYIDGAGRPGFTGTIRGQVSSATKYSLTAEVGDFYDRADDPVLPEGTTTNRDDLLLITGDNLLLTTGDSILRVQT